jgi:hypothetical protein
LPIWFWELEQMTAQSLWQDSQDNMSLLLFPEISPAALAMEMGREADVI